MKPALADAMVRSAAAYVHIPFCSKVCPYCDFAVVAGRDDLATRYVDAVCAEIESGERWRPLDAVYVGGGTPSHIDVSLLARIVDTIDRTHGIADGAEVGIEANPEDVSLRLAEGLIGARFNRLSLGVQSLDPYVLRYLGRRHDATQVRLAISNARSAGFENVSLDLIYGSPDEDDESWSQTLESATEAGPDHVSCYSLTVEPGTELGRRVRDGEAAPDPDTQAERYETAEAVLAAAGYSRYEVSNWAKPAYECRYNLTVWAQGEYEGYGNGAHGHRRGIRFRNYRMIDKYLEAVESGGSSRAGEEPVEGWDREVERLFVGLRRSVGVADGPGVQAFLGSEGGSRLVEAGVVTYTDGRLAIARPLLTDEVHRVVLDLEPDAEHGAAVDNVTARSDA